MGSAFIELPVVHGEAEFSRLLFDKDCRGHPWTAAFFNNVIIQHLLQLGFNLSSIMFRNASGRNLHWSAAGCNVVVCAISLAWLGDKKLFKLLDNRLQGWSTALRYVVSCCTGKTWYYTLINDINTQCWPHRA